MNLFKQLVRSFTSSTFALFLAASVHAHYKAGIQGTIQDKSGAAVNTAKVTLPNQGTGIQHEAVSSDTGFYRFTELPPGIYTLTVEMAGFENALNLTAIPNFSSNDDLTNTFSFGRVPGGLAGRVIEFQARFSF